MNVALVTGGSRGIGRAIVTLLALKGYAVAFTYRQNAAAARALCRQLKRRKVVVFGEQQDSRDGTGVNAFVSRVVKRFGHIDVLVNNAAMLTDVPLYLMEEKEWDRVLEVNVKGAYNFCRACVPHMMRRKRGRIVNIASVAGLHGIPGQTNYCASKGALIAFSKSLARETARFGVTVNVVAPGYIETAMVRGLPKERRAALGKEIPLGRIGKPEEVARAVLFLIEEASYMTGHTLVVDGGLLA